MIRINLLTGAQKGARRKGGVGLGGIQLPQIPNVGLLFVVLLIVAEAAGMLAQQATDLALVLARRVRHGIEHDVGVFDAGTTEFTVMACARSRAAAEASVDIRRQLWDLLRRRQPASPMITIILTMLTIIKMKYTCLLYH